MNQPDPPSTPPPTLVSRIRNALIGPPRDVHDPSISHKMALVAFLAWVGLGADGLSSSAYGPEEAYRALGEHTSLAVFLFLATSLTVIIISWTYSKIIEQFPDGGGGYIVATSLLGDWAGVASGGALLVDYVLTITTSIAGGGDAVFSLLPERFLVWKLPVEFAAIMVLIVLNLRGVKESVTVLVPIFLAFIVTHVILIVGCVIYHLKDLPGVYNGVSRDLSQGAAMIGAWGMFKVFLQAYSMGGGTYTGIEAVSSGVSILREPRIETGKRTMVYMAASLAFIAGGLLLCYMLARVQPVTGRTLNAVLAHELVGGMKFGFLPVGAAFVLVAILSEAVLLLTAAQTGFLGGPRIMANMAVDGWLPRRFSSLSDRLTMQNGIVLMGVAAIGILAYTRGHIQTLLIMYSINVFVTFTLSQVAMIRHWMNARRRTAWKKNLAIHGVGLFLCGAILIVMLVEKLGEGGWVTVLLTSALIGVCAAIRKHYRNVTASVREVDQTFANLPRLLRPTGQTPEFDPAKPTAAILVGGYGGLGIHILLSIIRLFPNTFHNIVFMTVGVVDSDFFREGEHAEALEQRAQSMLDKYVGVATRMGLPARSAMRVGADVVGEASELCVQISREYGRVVFFAGSLAFDQPRWYDRLLHNETAYAIQRQIKSSGLAMVILPMLVARQKRWAEGATQATAK